MRALSIVVLFVQYIIRLSLFSIFAPMPYFFGLINEISGLSILPTEVWKSCVPDISPWPLIQAIRGEPAVLSR